MPIRYVHVDSKAFLSPIDLNHVHIVEALTRGFTFAKILGKEGEQTLHEGYGYTGLYLPRTRLGIRRGHLQDDSFLRLLYVQERDVAVVLEAQEAKRWELEEYGSEF